MRQSTVPIRAKTAAPTKPSSHMTSGTRGMAINTPRGPWLARTVRGTDVIPKLPACSQKIRAKLPSVESLKLLLLLDEHRRGCVNQTQYVADNGLLRDASQLLKVRPDAVVSDIFLHSSRSEENTSELQSR